MSHHKSDSRVTQCARHMEPANEHDVDHMRLLDSLIRTIDVWPAELRAFESQYEIYGSWSLVIRRGGVRTRIVFDGRDRWLEAKRLPSDAGDFSQPPRHLGGMDLPSGLSVDSLPIIVSFIDKYST